MLKGLFGFELDLYQRLTKGGHARAELPSSVGKGAPFENHQEMENNGIELVVNHRNNIGEISYDMSFIFDRYRNKVTKFKNPASKYREGKPINEYHLLDWIGIYQMRSRLKTYPSMSLINRSHNQGT